MLQADVYAAQHFIAISAIDTLLNPVTPHTCLRLYLFNASSCFTLPARRFVAARKCRQKYRILLPVGRHRSPFTLQAQLQALVRSTSSPNSAWISVSAGAWDQRAPGSYS